MNRLPKIDACDAPPAPAPAPHDRPVYTLAQMIGYFVRLGTFGFGGPVALVGYMRRDLVDTRQWLAEADYKEGLALAQLAPGPLAAQLAIYRAIVKSGVRGSVDMIRRQALEEPVCFQSPGIRP